MSTLPQHALRFVGGANVVFAGLGFLYDGSGLFSSFPADSSTPYFSHAFYAMSAICLACYLTLLVIGIQFVRLKSSLVPLFTGVMIFEVVYFFSIALFGMIPGIGMSVAAASGVANGGMMFQFLPLFPLWGALLARWAKKGMEARPSDGEVPFFASEQVNRPSDWAWAVINFVVIFALASVLINMGWQRVKGVSFPPAFIGFGIPVLLGALNAFASVKGRRRRRRKQIEQRHAARLQAGLCPRCEYSLKGLTENRCPECGQQVPVSAIWPTRQAT